MAYIIIIPDENDGQLKTAFIDLSNKYFQKE